MKRGNFYYWICNIILLYSFLVTLLLVVLGIDTAAEGQTYKSFGFLIIGVGYVMACGCAMAINIKRAFRGS